MANAKDKLKVNIHIIHERLDFIAELTDKYDSISKPNYGHVGDLACVNDQLMELVQFLKRKGKS